MISVIETPIMVTLISSGLGLIGVLAGLAVRYALESRKLHYDVARTLQEVSADIGRKNGRGPVTRMVEELLDRTAKIENQTENIQNKVNELDRRVGQVDKEAESVRRVVLDLVASQRTGGRRSTDPKHVEILK